MIQSLEHKALSATQWTADALFYEFSKAVAPKLPVIPCTTFPAELHQQGCTRLIPLDLSDQLQCAAPAITPNLSAHFLRICAGENLTTSSHATAQLFYVIQGAGQTETEYGTLKWSGGDLFTLPACEAATHTASADTALYWVSDEALLNYLGVRPTYPRFKPTLYCRERLLAELELVAQEPGAQKRNRIGVLLGNTETHLTRSLTHTLWALLVYLPAGAVQKPHCHNSVAIDFVIDAPPGVYTLVGKALDVKGDIIDGKRVYWQPGSVFVTPPGLWHSHHNESDQAALLLPIQDAGFHSYMRTLDQRYA
jgi:gentisate 1,2-dioxygenase